MSTTTIEWTEKTWNPVTGCTKLSQGCKHCYAHRMALRLQGMGQRNYVNGFEVTCHEHMLELPMTWKKPCHIFANSMSDLFHKDVPEEFIQRVFGVMHRAHWHQFQLLTKRSGRLRELGHQIDWSDNVWAGVTVESADYTHRIKDLVQCGAIHKFLSIEPLLGPIPNLDLRGIDWIIVGGESGPGARPMDPAWVREIRDQCVSSEVPFFFKQWGGKDKKKSGRLLDGRIWDQTPLHRDAA